jgi:aspartyl-tRNA(Asn)/glutamyl-tRNA(Gln) amidotransferase subunit A
VSDLHYLTIAEANSLLRSRRLSAVELTEAILRRVNKLEPQIRSYVTISEELAMRQAKQADVRISTGEASPLTGIPMQIKDNICTNGLLTTCSSRMLQEFIPPYDATVTQLLQGAGAVMLGKGNMDEFAMGSSTENSAFFPTHNPWDIARVPGGSSGGPAAAVAAGQAVFSLGSDTGGSIRQPAALCGIVGLKPTYGLVSRYGLIAFASSLDQIGPITRDVTDSAMVLNAIAGNDHRDSTSLPNRATDYTLALKKDLKGVRLGVPSEYFPEGIQPGIQETLDQAISILEGLGATVDRNLSLPYTRYALAAYYIIAPSEASANLARYDGAKYGFSDKHPGDIWQAMERTRQIGFGPEVKRRIMLGTYSLSTGYYDAYYVKAQKVRTLIRREFEEAFQEYDAIVTPTSPSAAFMLGEKMAEPLQMYSSDVCTIPANIAGIPAISIPAGFVQGLPVGMQVVGPHFGEETILRVAYAYEQATCWHTSHPIL